MNETCEVVKGGEMVGQEGEMGGRGNAMIPIAFWYKGREITTKKYYIDQLVYMARIASVVQQPAYAERPDTFRS